MEELEYQSLCAFLASDKQKRVWPSEAAAGKEISEENVQSIHC